MVKVAGISSLRSTGLSLLMATSFAVSAAGPAAPGTAKSGTGDPAANKVEEAPVYQSNTSKQADEHAAEMLNKRDQSNERARKAKGDRTLENAEAVTRESRPRADQPKDRPSDKTPHPQ
jgi:hypothetical protein